MYKIRERERFNQRKASIWRRTFLKTSSSSTEGRDLIKSSASTKMRILIKKEL